MLGPGLVGGLLKILLTTLGKLGQRAGQVLGHAVGALDSGEERATVDHFVSHTERKILVLCWQSVRLARQNQSVTFFS